MPLLGGCRGLAKVTKTKIICFRRVEKLAIMIAHICLWMTKGIEVIGKRVWNTYRYQLSKNLTLAALLTVQAAYMNAQQVMIIYPAVTDTTCF